MLKVDGYMLRGVCQALNCIFIHATFCVIATGASPGQTKMKPGVCKMTTFCNCGSNNWETVVDRQLTCTKYAVSSERVGRQTSNLVDGRSLDLRKSPLILLLRAAQQPTATKENTQQHKA